ncbi:MAG TPA: ABC transporter ATP-binding protein [Anaerolineales bacterium]|nr:ABC transporter ATP-binding protein [Anaerolineales bacterium]
MTSIDYSKLVTENRIKGLWLMMRGYRWQYLVANLMQGFSAGFKILTFILLQHFVDKVIGHPELGWQVLWIALGFIGLAALEGFATYLSGRIAGFASEGIAQRLRDFLYDHLQHLSFTYHDKTQTGELIQRVTSDVDAVRRFFAQQAIQAGRVVLLFIIIWAVVLSLNVRLGLISVVVIPVVFGISLLFFREIGKRYEKYQSLEGKVSTALQENLTGVRVVKAFNRAEYEIAKFEEKNHAHYEQGKRLLISHALYWPITDVMIGIQQLTGYVVAGGMVIRGELTIGTYLAYAWLMIWLLYPIRNLGRLLIDMSEARVSYGRIKEILSQTREPLDDGKYQPQDDLRGDVRFQQVNFQYEGEKAGVLHAIDLNVHSGQIIGLIGPTGAGKSSLVNLLLRFYDYNSGSIQLDGVELRDYPRDYLRRQIGIVQQEPFLFSRTIRENITYGLGRPATDEEIYAAARAAAVHDVILSFPDQYYTVVGERGVTLSGGQKQRVALARILLKNPHILILDDTTSAVDSETEEEIRAALKTIMHNRTTFIIAHRIQSVMLADQIVVLDKGQIVQLGKHQQLLAQPGLYRRIYEVQAQVEAELEQELAN